uniref:NBAS subunit of NRZ tethering complex n=1 Tax=Oncorhynchus tshawytscha TaxID=74940 RepID=A0AAZ3SJA4_ONCTS
DSVVSSDDLLAWLRPFCSDGSRAVRPRIEVLQILENNFSLRDSDVHLLLLYRTQAVLKDLQDIVFTEEMLESAEYLFEIAVDIYSR